MVSAIPRNVFPDLADIGTITLYGTKRDRALQAVYFGVIYHDLVSSVLLHVPVISNF